MAASRARIAEIRSAGLTIDAVHRDQADAGPRPIALIVVGARVVIITRGQLPGVLTPELRITKILGAGVAVIAPQGHSLADAAFA
jgi:hypothetical protein